MSSTTLPKPVSAYVGLLASTVSGAADTVRHPASVTRLPLLAVSSLLMARERYEELAERGEVILQGVLGLFGGSSSQAARRGSGLRATVDQVHDTATARVADVEEQLEERAGAVVTRLQDAAEQAARAGQKVTGGPAGPIGTGARAFASVADRAAERVERAADAVAPPEATEDAGSPASGQSGSPEETMVAEVAAAPTTDRGFLEQAPAAGGPNAAESGALGAAVHAVVTELGQAAAAATTAPDPHARLVDEPGAEPTTDRGVIDDAPPATPPPAPPIPPAARKAAKSARKAATKAAPPAKRAVPPPSAAAPSATGPSATGPSIPAPTTPAPTGSPADAVMAPPLVPAGAGLQDAPVVPAGHHDGITIPEAIRTAAGPLRSHAELPLADFDHMTMGSLRGRLRGLDAVALVQLLDYERAHASRLPILTLLQNRLRKTLTDQAGEPGA